MPEARLGFAIDSSQAASAAADLDKLTSSAAKAEQAAGKTSAAGSRMSQSFSNLSPSLDKIVGSLGRLETITTSIDQRLEAMAKSAGKAASANAVLDRSAVEASTAYRQLEASLNAVQAAQSKADTSLAKSLGMIDKQREAIAKLNAELAKLRANPGPNPNNPPSPKPANNNFQTANITSQFQDIGVTAFGGSSPSTIALQQGTQLASALATSGGGIKGAAGALAAGLGSLFSPLSLATVAFTGLAAAGIQYATKTGEQVKDLDDALQDHAKYIKVVEERYGSLAEKARGASVESANVLNFQGGSDKRIIQSATNRAQLDAFEQTGANLGRLRGGRRVVTDISVDSDYRPVEDALRKLRTEVKAGKPDFDAFYDSLYKAASADPKFAKKADELAPFIEKIREGTKALQEMERIQRALFDDRGPNGRLLSQGTTNSADMGNYAAFQKQQQVAAARSAQALDAQIASIRARSPDERANAAGATAAAVYNNDETPAQTRQRVSNAIALSQVQSEKELADAQRDRAQSLDKLLADQKMETSLIGETANATEDLRQKYSLTAALRAEAARKGITDETEFQKVYGGEIEQIDKVIAKQRELITQRDMMMSRTVAAQAQTQYDATNVGALSDLQRAQGAAIGAIGARTPQQLANAARARVLAEPVNPGKESDTVRQYRADSAAALAYAQAENQLKEAQRSRMLNLDKILDDQRSETALIGQTGGAAAALRKEYELTSAAKIEAAQRGAEADAGELARIHQTAEALKLLTDQYNQQKFNFDINQQNSDARLSSRDQQITTRLRQSGLPEDLNGSNAKAIGQQIDWSDAKAATKGFFTDFENQMMSSGGKIGKSLGTSIENALMNQVSKAWDKIFDQLGNVVADWLTGKPGTSGSGSTGVGAIGAIGSKLFGGSAANSNLPSVGDVVGKTRTGIPLTAISAGGLSAKVASDAAPQFQGLLNDLKAKGYPITSLGEGGYSYRNVAGTSHLSNHAFGQALDINPRQNPQAPGATGNWAQYGIDPTAEAKQFGMTYGGNWKLPDTMHFQIDKTAQSLDKLTTSSTNATQGLGQIGKLSSSFFPAAPSGGVAGSGGGWLSLLSGSIFSGSGQLAKSGGIGLFASGTDSAPGGMAIVGEKGPELVNLPKGSQVIPNHKLGGMAANSDDQSYSQQPKYEIHIHGGSGDDHIRGLVNQGIQQADGQRSDQMRRGGINQLNTRYGNQKG